MIVFFFFFFCCKTISQEGAKVLYLIHTWPFTYFCSPDSKENPPADENMPHKHHKTEKPHVFVMESEEVCHLKSNPSTLTLKKKENQA